MPLYTELGPFSKEPMTSEWILEIQDTSECVRVGFYKKVRSGSDAHRLDGPAVILWNKKSKGVTRLYYIDGVCINDKEYLKVLNCPMEDLPLYINEPRLSKIAAARLIGERTTVVSFRHQDTMEEVKHKCRVYDDKQRGVVNLINKLSGLANKILMTQINNFKPFECWH